jgi:type I restriction enzyme S subunit
MESRACTVFDSGVEWLGVVPATWRVLQTRRVCSLTTGGRDTQDATEDGAYPFFVRSQVVERIDTYSFDGEGVLTAGDGVGVGKVFHHYVGKLEVHQRVYLYHAFTHVLGRFFFYYLREHLHRVVLAGNAKSTVDSLRRPMLQEFPVVVPPRGQQHAIVAFLDRKTASIDALIVKKERLIELLREKRQALITQAVTKGLDPTVAMKDSGIEWLRNVPAHWTVQELRHRLRHIEQGWSPSCENREAENSEWGVLKVGCVNYGRFRESENKALPSDLEPLPELEVRAGDILVSRANTRELVGSAAFVESTRPRLLLCDKLFRLHYRGDTNPRFFALLLQSSACRVQFEREATGASGSMQNIGQDSVRRLVFAWAPLDEQMKIVESVEDSTRRIDNLCDAISVHIEKLREYRQGLITAAVTGKIDVSHEAA